MIFKLIIFMTPQITMSDQHFSLISKYYFDLWPTALNKASYEAIDFQGTIDFVYPLAMYLFISTFSTSL